MGVLIWLVATFLLGTSAHAQESDDFTLEPQPTAKPRKPPRRKLSPEELRARKRLRAAERDLGLDRPVREPTGWRFGAGAGFHYTPSIDFAEANFNNETVKATLTSTSAPFFILEARFRGENDVGVQLGGSLDLARSITQYEFQYASLAETGSYKETPLITFYTSYINLVYNLEDLYVFGGLNFSMMKMENPPAFLKDSSGTWRFQGGVGYDVQRNFSIELLWRELGLTGRKFSDVTGNYEARSGRLGGVAASAKYYFY